MTTCELINFYGGINLKCEEFQKKANRKTNKYFKGITKALVDIKGSLQKL